MIDHSHVALSIINLAEIQTNPPLNKLRVPSTKTSVDLKATFQLQAITGNNYAHF